MEALLQLQRASKPKAAPNAALLGAGACELVKGGGAFSPNSGVGTPGTGTSASATPDAQLELPPWVATQPSVVVGNANQLREWLQRAVRGGKSARHVQVRKARASMQEERAVFCELPS